ncbi:uncharacterized protein LOC117338074 [Pecten maximus]|uniref:uncharacterized protein LOC117338074 n=1 Tax=Pecten maximus TaxID=6579 RepID=UPI001458699F|nr:uncharacterized protein LOC117338074 [Pecten maximus]
MCLLGFAGFLRFSELVNIKRSDLEFFQKYMTIIIPRSKTDVHGSGSELVISRTATDLCPVSMVERYLNAAHILPNSTDYIFRQLSYCKLSNCYRLRNSGPLSYTRAREILLEKLEIIGLDSKRFGLHSLRSGGATAAANAGVIDRMFKKHGRWKSDKAKDGYVHENIDERTSVTKKLGL